jgi:hypothetical protein
MHCPVPPSGRGKSNCPLPPVGEGQGEGGGVSPSHIHIDLIAMQLHQIAPRLRLALAHQLGE